MLLSKSTKGKFHDFGSVGVDVLVEGVALGWMWIDSWKFAEVRYLLTIQMQCRQLIFQSWIWNLTSSYKSIVSRMFQAHSSCLSSLSASASICQFGTLEPIFLSPSAVSIPRDQMAQVREAPGERAFLNHQNELRFSPFRA